MLPRSFFKIYVLLACVAILFSCEKDSDHQLEIQDIIPEPTEKVYGTIQGIIVDEEAQIIESAQVSISDQSTRTDENGFFTVEGFFPLDGTPIRASKAGYFESNALILPSADGITKVNIRLVKIGQTAATETGRIIDHQTDHASVLFPKDAFVHTDGTAFDGVVSISSKYFDPTSEAFSNSYPGILKSTNLLESKMLFPFGLLKVELADEQDRPLQVNQEVQITMEVPTELLAFAPAQIPLWYLNEATGLWVQEGSAQLEGDTYIGIVTHFTDWVCALGLDYVLMTGQVTKEGTPFPYANMGISYRVGSRFRFSSDEQGNFSFPIIIGGEQYNVNYFETINLDVRSNCGNILFEEKDIPQPTMDFSKEIDVRSSAAFTITGQVFCTRPDSTLSNAYVLIQFNEGGYQEIVPVNKQGKFELVVEECGLSEVTLIGFDAINLQRSDPVQVSENNTSISLNVCEEPFQSKVTFDIDGEELYMINNCTVEIIDSITYWHYQFKAIDSFSDFSDAVGQSNEYTINVFQPKEGEGEVPAQVWRYTQPQPSHPDVPYSIAFGTWTFEILSETEDKIIVLIPLGENVPGNHGTIFKYGGAEIKTVINGFALLEANK